MTTAERTAYGLPSARTIWTNLRRHTSGEGGRRRIEACRGPVPVMIFLSSRPHRASPGRKDPRRRHRPLGVAATTTTVAGAGSPPRHRVHLRAGGEAALSARDPRRRGLLAEGRREERDARARHIGRAPTAPSRDFIRWTDRPPANSPPLDPSSLPRRRWGASRTLPWGTTSTLLRNSLRRRGGPSSRCEIMPPSSTASWSWSNPLSRRTWPSSRIRSSVRGGS
mmetsp:Transcript_60137/g.178318  ORF Transcript_60137/g.178318 Transcript_60137/m.178318 type:complete len:224 (+) Transcript_60137:700-1371(+)